MTEPLTDDLRQRLLTAQRNEITEHHIYARLADTIKDQDNAAVLRRISEDEKRHYNIWKKYTGEDVEPSRLKLNGYYWISRILGITFGIKLMEAGEESAQTNYEGIAQTIPEATRVSQDENGHEDELIAMIDEERLQYIGAIVRGLNDALVELTGALSGMTFVLGNTQLIATTGLITGIAASFSMAGSEYLARRSGEEEGDPIKGAFYTGFAYIITVMALILPYLLFSNIYVCLGLMMLNAVIIIAMFNYYMSVAKEQSFWRSFGEMVSISLGISLLTFGIGYVIRQVFGIEV